MLAHVMTSQSKIDYVLVYSLSRLSRDMGTFMQTIAVVLQKYSVGIRSVLEHTDDTPTGRFMQNLFVSVSRLDNEINMQYTKDNMRALAAQGYWQNAPPLGYKSAKNPNEKGQLRPTIEPNEMAPLVTDVLETFSTGKITKATLTRYARELGLRSRNGKLLTETSIRLLLQSPIQAGYVTGSLTDGELVPGKHTAIISTDTYEKNQILLNRKDNYRLGELHSRQNELYPLPGHVLCHNCNNPLYASAPKTGNGGSSPRYHCARQTCKGLVPSIKADILHSEFKEMLKK